jgi:AcrR family transcriptional regulator
VAYQESKSDDAGQSRPLSTRERQRRETRNLILTVALAEISEVGLSEVRIEQIARKAGVTRPTVHAYFPKREDFLRGLQAQTSKNTLATLRKRLRDRDGVQLAHKLADALFDLIEKTSPKLRRESFALMLREPKAEEWMGNDSSHSSPIASARRNARTRLPVTFPPTSSLESSWYRSSVSS